MAEKIGGSGIVDLGSLRDRREGEQEGEALERILGHAFYANDAKVSLDPNGTVTLEFFFRNNQREYDPVTVSIPVGIFMELAGLAPQVMEEVRSQMAAQQQRAAQRGQSPSSMGEARALRDRG